MPHNSAEAVRNVISLATAGDENAAECLLSMLYKELHLLAHHRMAKLPPGNTLDTTALVHEAYLRVAGKDSAHWDGRRHFFFAAARAMHDILVEQARRKASLKRGGGLERRSLEDVVLPFEKPSEDVLALHDALRTLEKEDPACARMVLLRYFTGLTAEQTAEVLQCSASTVKRQWRFARAWLRRAMAATGTGSRDLLRGS